MSIRKDYSVKDFSSSSATPLRKTLLSALGLMLGTSALLNGFYDAAVWGPILLGTMSILVALLVARPAVPTGTALIAVGGLLALWLWSLLSGSWTEASDLAVIDANRWLLYAAVLVLALYLANDAESRRWLLGATTAGVLIVTAYILLRFLAGEGPDLFLGNRLDRPLGYINGVASYLLVGIWPLLALTERARHPVIRGLGAFGAVQLIALAVLTQSRGGLLALIAATVVILIVVPGRLTRAWALIAILAGVAVGTPAILDVVQGSSAPTADALRSVAVLSLIGGVAAGGVWALACVGAESVARRPESVGRSIRTASITVVALIGVAVVAVAILPPGQRVDQARSQYDAFTSLQPTGGDSRLTSGGGNRYDYWRVAVKQLGDDPLKGVGAGNYTRTYFQERRTTEDVQQAHSIELQTLGELGLVGGLALTAFVGAVLFGFWHTAHGSATRRSNPALAVAAGGTFLVWLLQTSVDWMHLIPGLTGIAICAAATLLPSLRPLGRKIPVVAAVGVTVIIGLAAFPVANQVLALRFQSKAEDKVQTDPVGSIVDARTSIALLPSQETYYLESSAFASLGLYGPARDALLEAADRVPHDFVAWGLLGDLATRRGLGDVARRNYQRAAALNPQDPGLAALAQGEVDKPQP